MPYTYKNKNDLHIWASLRGLAGSRAAKAQIIIDNTNFLAGKNEKVDFFDIFVFNNVKSDLKIILCQPNKVVFKVNVLSL